jgi:hypothetical protein
MLIEGAEGKKVNKQLCPTLPFYRVAHRSNEALPHSELHNKRLNKNLSRCSNLFFFAMVCDISAACCCVNRGPVLSPPPHTHECVSVSFWRFQTHSNIIIIAMCEEIYWTENDCKPVMISFSIFFLHTERTRERERNKNKLNVSE